jgi:hypothetical protein
MWPVPAPWWTKLPSLAPVKGFSRFLYIWTHWDTISDEQKKRDERLQAVEELANQMVRLKTQAYEEEKRALERALEQQRKGFDVLASRGFSIIDNAMDHIKELHTRVATTEKQLDELARWFALYLYIEEVPGFSDYIVSKLPPPLRQLVSEQLVGFAEIEDRQKRSP